MSINSILNATFFIENFMSSKEIIDEQHNKKINEIIDKYRLTKIYQRKKKKRIRKELNSDYSFFMQLHEMDNMEFHW